MKKFKFAFYLAILAFGINSAIAGKCPIGENVKKVDDLIFASATWDGILFATKKDLQVCDSKKLLMIRQFTEYKFNIMKNILVDCKHQDKSLLSCIFPAETLSELSLEAPLAKTTLDTIYSIEISE